MRVAYDLTFMVGSVPPFENLSEIYFRPPGCLNDSLEYFNELFPDVQLHHVSLNGELTRMVTILQDKLAFPFDTSHSLDAFGDHICNLSWLGAEHIILVIEFEDRTDDLDKYMLIDTFSWAVNMLNVEREMRLSVLILV